MNGFKNGQGPLLGIVLLVLGAGLIWFGKAMPTKPPEGYTGLSLIAIGIFVLPVAVGVLIAAFKQGEDH